MFKVPINAVNMRTLTPVQLIADEAVARIAAIYNSDNKSKKSSEVERLNNRQKSVQEANEYVENTMLAIEELPFA